MPKKAARAGSIKWTGKNLAEVRRFHRRVAHYPEKANQPAHYRDYTQHPDNLHVTTDEGHTVIAEIGDSIHRDAAGRITLVKAEHPQAPRALRPVPPSTGNVYHETAGGRPLTRRPRRTRNAETP